MANQKKLSAAEVIAAAAHCGWTGRRRGTRRRDRLRRHRGRAVRCVPQDAVGRPTVTRQCAARCRSPAPLGCSLVGFLRSATTLGLWLLAMTRFMFPNVVREPPTRVKVGFPADYPPGHVETRFKTSYGLWVVHGQYQGQQQIYALKTVCTHLGCTPNWLEAEQKFKCPCHGSGFSKDGDNFEGPAPRPLERYAIRIADDGQIEVDKSRDVPGRAGPVGRPGVLRQGVRDERSTGHAIHGDKFIRNSQIWKSIFRHPAPVDRRNRVVVVLTNFILHLHPVSIKKHAVDSVSPGAWAASRSFCSWSRRSPACC